MAHEVIVVLALVVSDTPPDARDALLNLRGRELGGVPGSLVTRVAVRTITELAQTTEPTGDRATDRDGYTSEELASELDYEHGLIDDVG